MTTCALVSHDDPVLDQAARWFELFQQSDLKYKTIVEWEQWMSESRAHRAAFSGLQSGPEMPPPVPAPTP
jgi:ferric-dicitrate binding protein FerR (iron transport regulator)